VRRSIGGTGAGAGPSSALNIEGITAEAVGQVRMGGGSLPSFWSRRRAGLRGGTGNPLSVDRGHASDAFRELGMLSQQFAFERVTLIAVHRRDIKRILCGTEVSTVSFGRPCTRDIHASAVRYARFGWPDLIPAR
jgi:hypothetical protein